MEEDMQQRTRRRFNDSINGPRHKQEHEEEDEAGESANADTSNHDPRPLDCWVRYLFNHMRHSIIARQPEPGLQKTQKPSHAVGPSSLVDEFSENEVAG